MTQTGGYNLESLSEDRKGNSRSASVTKDTQKQQPKPMLKRRGRKTRSHRGGAQYSITNYTYKQARKLGVTVKPSTNKTKKIDVFKGDKKVASVGANGMGDFPTFMRTEGMASAKEHRRRYKMRHEKDRHVTGSRGWYADKLLW
jgi:hypothetical protein